MRNNPYLESVSLNYKAHLDPKQIILSGCKKLTDVHLSLNSLKKIDLSKCGSLKEVTITSGDLDELRIEGCDKLSKITLPPHCNGNVNIGHPEYWGKFKQENISWKTIHED